MRQRASLVLLLLAACQTRETTQANAVETNTPPATVVAQSVPAPEQWRIIDSYPGGTFSIDPASIHREGTTVTVATRLISRPADTAADVTMISHLRFDCVQRTSTLLNATLPGRDGRPVPYTPEPIESQPVAGHAALEAALNELCPR